MTAGELEQRMTIRESWEWGFLYKREELERKTKESQAKAAAQNKQSRGRR